MTSDASLEQELRDVFQRHEYLADEIEPTWLTARRSEVSEPPARVRGGRSGKSAKTVKRRRDPAWARTLVVAGALLMMISGGGIVAKDILIGYATHSVKQEDLLNDVGNQAKGHVSINGAKNILLVGIDPRPDQPVDEPIRSDSILILHVPASHDAGFLISIPRDTWVRIPQYNNGKHRYLGGFAKVNAAFAEGGTGLTGKEQRKNGTKLLASTIKQNWGITFDAAAIVDFTGFQQVVNVLGGVDMYIDQRTISVHIGHDAKGDVKVPFKQRDNGHGGTDLIPIPGVKPVVYEVGYRHLQPWQALDYVRQRETLPNSDYDRQRHQQQFIKALFKEIVSKDVLSDPIKLKNVLDIVGKAMTIDSGGIDIDDWVYAMRGIDGEHLMTLKTNNGTFHASPENPGAEALDETTLALLQAVRNNTVVPFVSNNPTLVSQS